MARKPGETNALPDLKEIESEMSQVRSKSKYRLADHRSGLHAFSSGDISAFNPSDAIY